MALEKLSISGILALLNALEYIDETEKTLHVSTDWL